SDAATYTVDVSNSFSSATSANAVLTLIVPPTITTQPSSRTNNYGTTATFTVAASGTSLSFQWQKNAVNLANGGNVSGVTTATLSLTSVTQSDAATYRVVVTNSAGSVTSANATLTVIDPVITTQPQSIAAPAGGNATFSVTAIGTASLKYQWKKTGVAISGATNSALTLLNVQNVDVANYTVVVSNSVSSVTSATATLTVNNPPTITLGTARVTEPIANFESFTNGTANGTVLFRAPIYSPTTGGFIDSSTNYATVTTSFPSGNARAATKVLKAGWGFATGPTNPWVRLTTSNPTDLPNPTIYLDKIFRFDIYSTKSLKVGVGARETATTADIGANGGTSGLIEFVGVTNVVSTSPFPNRIVNASNWATLEFNFPTEPVMAFTGDGILATGKGVLEDLALVPNGGMGAYSIYVDNFEVATTSALPGTLSMNTGSTLTFTATATDPDLPAQTLTFSLDAGAPTGASISGTTGAFTWTPTTGQANTTNIISVRVKDNGAGLLSDVKTFTVMVTSDPFSAQGAQRVGAVAASESVKLQWDAIAGRTYQLQYKTNLNEATWQNGSIITATHTPMSIQVSDEARFYRIVELNTTDSLNE
ncbi:MAG: multidomain protein with s-layer y region, glug motif, ig motif, i-set domain, pkd domain, partial [Verrucomicrobiales bacterium]|nr:multidomain protein with s-layer y region, glug motif, ig motif, i-set domain, pkd domain [Verrucomicrobiales bacterium]